MISTQALLLIHAGVTLAMTGLVWFVQFVHYPLFVEVDKHRFPAFALAHRRRTTRIVAPLMLAEAATATLLLGPLAEAIRHLALLGGFLLALIWLSTALVQVPLHRRLADGFDASAVQMLVRTNWLRTIAWTLRSLIALRLLES